MNLSINPNQYKTGMITIISILAIYLASCTATEKASSRAKNDEQVYMQQIRNDFIQHKEDITAIYNINSGIVRRLDSLFNGLRKDTANSNLINGIMNTRAFNLSIAAYRGILNADYIKDAQLKLKIATHVAWFEGVAQSKRHWDEQWDNTARPYIYNNGLFKSADKKTNLIADPVFRTVLWDRRMFAHDTEIYAPRLISSADSVITLIDALLKK
jgi:hypothetical protein